MIYSLLSALLIVKIATAQSPPDCGGNGALGCMTNAECATFGAGILCGNIDATLGIGCCQVPTTTTTTTTVATTTVNSTCVDKLNPLTGVSDCPARASLCTNSVYLAVMTQQCPRTCGFCSSTSTTTNTTCVDLTNPSTGVSDCSSRRAYCTNTIYQPLMRIQCPVTCGFCSSSTTTTNTTCVDLTNPYTGVSDCSARRVYCTNTIYQSLMRIQCPATCGFCTSG